jgi:hypothetical protein
MAKRRRPRRRRSDLTDREYEELESKIEQRSREFAEEIEQLGRRLGMDIEHAARRHERERGERWFRAFDMMGPLVGSIFGIIFLAFGLWVLSFINLSLGSIFISDISNFFFSNLHWLFAAFLFFGYSNYFLMRFPKTYWLVSPIIGSLGAVFVLWISVSVLKIINVYASSSFITAVSGFVYGNLWGIFFAFVVFGYAVIFFRKLMNME